VLFRQQDGNEVSKFRCIYCKEDRMPRNFANCEQVSYKQKTYRVDGAKPFLSQPCIFDYIIKLTLSIKLAMLLITWN